MITKILCSRVDAAAVGGGPASCSSRSCGGERTMQERSRESEEGDVSGSDGRRKNEQSDMYVCMYIGIGIHRLHRLAEQDDSSPVTAASSTDASDKQNQLICRFGRAGRNAFGRIPR